MGEYDFDRLTRYKRVDVLQKALDDENEHQRFKAVEALEAVAVASGNTDSAARAILTQAATVSTHEDVKLHARIALKTLDTPQDERIQTTEEHRNNGLQHQNLKRNLAHKPLREQHQEDMLLCELDADCTSLMVRGSTLSARNRPSGTTGGFWDKDKRAWRFAINRASIDSLKDGGVVLHPTVHCLCTSSQNTWAAATRDKKWIKVVGDTREIEDALKQVPGSHWDGTEHAWIIPFKADSIKRLIRIDGLYVSPFILD